MTVPHHHSYQSDTALHLVHLHGNQFTGHDRAQCPWQSLHPETDATEHIVVGDQQNIEE